MGDFFSEIGDIMILAAVLAGFITLLFRIFYGSFKGRPETRSILQEKRVYIPVAIGSFILMIWVIYSLFHMGSASLTFTGAMIFLAAMAPVFKVYVRTTWQETIYLSYGFTLANVAGFLTVSILLASLV